MTSNSAIPSRVPAGLSVAPRKRPVAAARRVRSNSSTREGERFGSTGSLNKTAGVSGVSGVSGASRESGDPDAGRRPREFSATGAATQIAFWTIREVESAVKLKKSAIYERISRRAFPPPVKLSATVSVWIESEVRAWMQAAALHRPPI